MIHLLTNSADGKKAKALGGGKLRDATIPHPEISPSFVRTRFLDGGMVASLMKDSSSKPKLREGNILMGGDNS